MLYSEYKLIARVIKNHAPITNGLALPWDDDDAFRKFLAIDFADALAEQNPNFDYSKFLEECE